MTDANDKKERVYSDHGAWYVAVACGLVPGFLWECYGLSLIWKWLLVPYGAPLLPGAAWLGILLVQNLVTGKALPDDMPSEQVFRGLGSRMILIAGFVGVAWIGATFFVPPSLWAAEAAP